MPLVVIVFTSTRRWLVAVLAASVMGFAQSPPALPEQPLTLDQAMQEALEKNLDLIAQRYDLPIADARIVTARLRPNPVLSTWGLYLPLLGTTLNASQNAAGPSEAGARVDVILERGRKRQERVSVAETARTVAQYEVLNAVRLLTINVQTAFVDVLQAKADLALARENLATFGEIVDVNSARVKSGDLAEVELIRSQVAQLQFENTVRQAELRVQTARARLQLLLGRQRTDRLVDVIGEMRREPVVASAETVRETALVRRPDVLAQRQDQARSQAELRLQIAQGKVDYTVGASVHRQWVNPLAPGNTLSFYFSMPLPISNRNQGEIARAGQERLQAEARIRALEATILNEVDVAYLELQNARTTLGRIEDSLMSRSQDVRSITEFSYRRGEATFLELLDAQRAYNETMQAYNESRAAYARSLYTLESVTGIGVAQ